MSAMAKLAKMLAQAAEKGLDSAPAARKARAVEQGYLTPRRMKEIVDNSKNVKVVKTDNPSEYHSPLKGDEYDVYLNEHIINSGDKDYLDKFLNEMIENNLPGAVNPRIGLKREAYMTMFPSQYTAPAGFDMDAPMTFYHGGAGDFGAFNPNYLGRTTNASSADYGTFLSNLPEDADEYAAMAASRNPKENRSLELISRLNDEIQNAEKHKELYTRYNMADNGGDPKFIENQEAYIERLRNRMRVVENNMGKDNYASVYPVHVRPENPMFVDKQGTGYGDITSHLSNAKKRGHDSVIFFDIKDPNPNATHMLMFEPEKIRSVNAMFDPDRINSRDLLASFAGAGAIGSGLSEEFADGLMQEPQEFAAGGAVVKKGTKALQELLENMKKAHPERLKRAEEAGYDTSKVWLHGTNTDELINDGSFNHDKRMWTKHSSDPEKKGFYFSDDPLTAGHYASYYPMMREGETFDESVLRHQPSYLPVFLRNAKIIEDEGGKIKNLYEGIDWPIDHAVAYDTRDIRSIFNDFTPESLADEKFAAGGLVCPYE